MRIMSGNTKCKVAYFSGGSRLPAEFQEVEYLESTGTQWIDSGIIGKYGLKTYAKLVFTGNINDNAVLLGCRVNSQYTRLYMGYRQFNSLIRIGYQIDIETNVAPTVNSLMEYEYSLLNGYATIKENGTTILNQQLQNLTFNTNKNLYIFANNYTTAENLLSCKLYNLKIYDNGVLVRDFVPCYRKVDNVAGLYDLVDGVFYTNAGTGTFLKGNNVQALAPLKCQVH